MCAIVLTFKFMDHTLLAITALDGRYSEKIEVLNQYFSEAALMRYRVLIEVEWFIYLFNDFST